MRNICKFKKAADRTIAFYDFLGRNPNAGMNFVYTGKRQRRGTSFPLRS
jgi:hypothetical protein